MSSKIRHPFHMVNESPWPLLSSVAAFLLTISLVKAFHQSVWDLMFLSVLLLLSISAQWWNDVVSEGCKLGVHSLLVELGLRWGMILFICSEVFFFLSFFWAFFHSSLSPSCDIGSVWPPQGVKVFNPFGVPLLNTVILLASGVSVTWAHHSLISGNHKSAVQGLLTTVLLGGYFTFLQGLEYYEAEFTVADSVYGSSFFIATGFHGLHVIVGSLFLLVNLVRLMSFHLSPRHHFGFEAAAWYWHFVDVVWLFLFISVYWWGGE